MVTARLIDNIWATRKGETLNGCKLMLAQVIGCLLYTSRWV